MKTLRMQNVLTYLLRKSALWRNMCSVTVSQLRNKATKLRSARLGAEEIESEFRASLDHFLRHGDAQAFAEDIEVSPQYLCDIRKGRRKISVRFLEQVIGS